MNLKDEILEQSKIGIKCAYINYSAGYCGRKPDDHFERESELKCNYTDDEYNAFIESLDYEVDEDQLHECEPKVFLLNNTRLEYAKDYNSLYWDKNICGRYGWSQYMDGESMTTKWFIDHIGENYNLIRHLEPIDVLSLLQNRGYSNIQEVINYYELLNSGNNYELCHTMLT